MIYPKIVKNELAGTANQYRTILQQIATALAFISTFIFMFKILFF